MVQNNFVGKSMTKLALNLPKTMKFDEQELTLILATKLYEQGRLSLGQAADLAGYSKRGFMEILGKNGVSVFNYSADDLDRDLENAKNYHI
jgi:predicted HTH domain antitoxin